MIYLEPRGILLGALQVPVLFSCTLFQSDQLQVLHALLTGNSYVLPPP